MRKSAMVLGVVAFGLMLANAAALGAPALACHFNNPGYNLVHELLVPRVISGAAVVGHAIGHLNWIILL